MEEGKDLAGIAEYQVRSKWKYSTQKVKEKEFESHKG